jgi:hypothetical protein
LRSSPLQFPFLVFCHPWKTRSSDRQIWSWHTTTQNSSILPHRAKRTHLNISAGSLSRMALSFFPTRVQCCLLPATHSLNSPQIQTSLQLETHETHPLHTLAPALLVIINTTWLGRWLMPVVPATQEAEAGESLEHRSSGPAWAAYLTTPCLLHTWGTHASSCSSRTPWISLCMIAGHCVLLWGLHLYSQNKL